MLHRCCRKKIQFYYWPFGQITSFKMTIWPLLKGVLVIHITDFRTLYFPTLSIIIQHPQVWTNLLHWCRKKTIWFKYWPFGQIRSFEYGLFTLEKELIALNVPCQHLIPAFNAWAACAQHNTQLYPWLPPTFLGMDDLTTESSFESQVTLVNDVLGLLFDMLSMGVCTTRHLQTSAWLLQELNVCST